VKSEIFKVVCPGDGAHCQASLPTASFHVSWQGWLARLSPARASGMKADTDAQGGVKFARHRLVETVKRARHAACCVERLRQASAASQPEDRHHAVTGELVDPAAGCFRAT
jgi:hypothetical protein